MEHSRNRRGRGGAVWATAGAARPEALRGFVRWPGLPWRDWLDEEVENRRLFPWLGVGFGAGILLYFAADREPALWAPLAGLALAAGACWRLRASLPGLALALMAAAAFAGFAAGVVRTALVDAPILGRTAIAPLQGFVLALDERSEGGRLLVRVHALGDLAAEARPALVRVTVRSAASVAPGDFVAAQVRLLPPPTASRPGGYDFRRDAFFKGIGAVGSVLGRVEVRPPPVNRPWSLVIAARIDAARNALTRRIAEAVGGQAGAVAAALVTGKRGLIDEETNDILRAAGIYHVVSISGLHMVLAAGVFFWLARALLALSPAAALFWPTKKIAAIVAMAGATAYCIFSGSEVATERSLIMTLVMLGAVLVDRPALSMRNLAISAVLVLAREPEALLGPSFQMSFGAVAGLIALAGVLARVHAGEEVPQDLAARVLRAVRTAVVGSLATTLVASLATAPFAAYHFQSANPFGIVGNALTLPLVSLVVMPGSVLGVLAYPFGLDAPVWQGIGLAVGWMLGVSAWVAGFDGSSLVVPAFKASALGLFAAALLFATLPVSPIRLGAVPLALAGLCSASAPLAYDVLVDREGVGAAVRGRDGRLAIVGKPSRFVVEQWLRADGDAREPDDPSLRRDARCDPLGCVVEAPDGRAIAFVAERAAFLDDCGRAAVILSRWRAPSTCQAAVVIDQTFLDARGATALKLTAAGTRIATVRSGGEGRPWQARARGRAPTPAAQSLGVSRMGVVPIPGAAASPRREADRLDAPPDEPGGTDPDQ